MTTASDTKGLLLQGLKLLLLMLLIALAAYANSHRHVEVTFSASSDVPGRLQIFHGRGAHSENRSHWFALDAQPRAHSLVVRGGAVARLRVDPPANTATVLCNLGVGKLGPSSQFDAGDRHTVGVERVNGCLRLVPEPGATDPQVQLHFGGVAAEINARAHRWHNVFLTSLAGATALVWWLMFSFRAQCFALVARLPVLPGVAWLERRLPWFGALLMLVFGIGYVFITPPGAVADEEAHLAKVVRIAHGAPFGASGMKLLPGTREMYGPFSDFLIHKQPFTGEQLRTQIRRPVECEAKTAHLARGADGYFPHQYLLPTLVYKTACVTDAAFGAFLYPARLLNLLLATVLVAWGLAYARRGRWGLWLVALLPMSLFQMGSISADSLALSLSLAWLGLTSGIVGGSLQPSRAAPALWALSLAIALLKPGSAWILASLIFCRSAYDASSSSFRGALIKFVGLPWAIHVLWAMVASGEAPVLAGVDPQTQASSLLGQPMVFAKAWANTFFSGNIMALLKMMVGRLGWLDVWLSPWSYLAGTVAMVAALATNATDTAPTGGIAPRYVSAISLLLALGSLVLISLPLFVLWTATGAPVIAGLQGRYFTATAAFVLTWCSFRSSASLRSLLIAFIVATVVAINVDALHRLYQAYYLIGRV